MDPQHVTSAYYEWTHGTKSLVVAYVIIAAFSWVGLKRGRAGAREYFYWPLTSLATMAVVALVLTIVAALLPPSFGANDQSVTAALVNFMLLALGGFLGGLYWSRRATAAKPGHTRGAVVADASESQRLIRKLAAEGAASPRAAVRLAGVGIPFADETKHFKLMGTTGAGKSTAMRELLQGALARGDRAVITDPDGGYLARFYNRARGDIILNPFDSRSVRWDLFAELQNDYDVEQLASALIPDRANADPTWTSHARTLFCDIVRRVRGSVNDLHELHRLLTIAGVEELKMLLEGTAAAALLEEQNAKFFGSIRGTMREHLKALEYVAAGSGEACSVRDWIKSGTGVLFIPYRADQIPALKSTISAWMRLAIVQTLSLEEGDCRLWFAIDEMDALGPIDGLADALPRLRKFGGRCILGFQTISQPGSTYGKSVAQTIVENCGTSLILRCSASEDGGTSAFASRLIGERQVLRMIRSKGVSQTGLQGTTSRGSSEQHATEYAVMPAEIEQLPDCSGFLKFPSQPLWLRVSFPYCDLPKVAAPFAGADNAGSGY